MGVLVESVLYLRANFLSQKAVSFILNYTFHYSKLKISAFFRPIASRQSGAAFVTGSKKGNKKRNSYCGRIQNGKNQCKNIHRHE